MASLSIEMKVDEHESADSHVALLLEAAYQRYARHVYTLCLRLLTDVSAAESATVSVFVRFSRGPAGWWEENSMFSRLRELAIGEALAQLWGRGGVPELPSPSSLSVSPASGLEEHPVPLDPILLDALIARLPDAWRIIYVLHDVEGLNESAIAALLRSSRETVRRCLHHVRQALLWQLRSTT